LKVLVTGATGIVGSNLVRRLLQDGNQVRVLVRRTSDARGLDSLDVERREGDVLEPSTLEPALAGCDILYHAAAVFSYSADAEEQEALAVRGTRNALRAARRAGVARVVLTSSSVVLGSSTRPEVLDETSCAGQPDNVGYALSKARQESTAFETAAELGLELVAVCPTLVMGSFDYRLSPSTATIVNYLNDPFRSTFLGGCNVVSARDAAEAHVLAAARGAAGSRYVVGSENLAWRDMHRLVSELAGTFGPSIVLNHTASYLAAAAAEAAARLAGRKPAVTRAEAQMSARFYWYSHARLAELGYRPVPARQALAEAIAWVVHRSYVTDSVVRKLELSPEVLEARSGFTAEAHA
jgi:dihydroflavonol-4-reductase